MKTLTVEGERPKVDYAFLSAVKEDIKRMFKDPRRNGMLEHFNSSDVEFLLSMGLLVRDVADRAKVLRECLLYTYIYGGPQAVRNRKLAQEAYAELRGGR